jgi:hypothetical protein
MTSLRDLKISNKILIASAIMVLLMMVWTD